MNEISGNACGVGGCHPLVVTDDYDEFIEIVDHNIPSQLNEGQSGNVYVNITITSTNYDGSDIWRCFPKIYVTSIKGLVSIQNSPQEEAVKKFPGFSKEYSFQITGASEGTDTIKINAQVRTGHGGGIENVSVFGNLEVIHVNAPPQLSMGKVSPTSGFNNSDYTYTVRYQDQEGIQPTTIAVIIDDGSPMSLTVADGTPDTIISGEDFNIVVSGETIGIGDDHTFRFSASDGLLDAIVDILDHDGPVVEEYIEPNKVPIVNIETPVQGLIYGLVNITGTASDPEVADTIDRVEVNVDNGTWTQAIGTDDWYIEWDFTDTTVGPHAIYARSHDGKDYSDADSVFVEVDIIVPEPPMLSITQVEQVSEDIIRMSGMTSQGNNSPVVDNVELIPDGFSWSSAKPEGPDLGNGSASFDLWSWDWNTSDVDAGDYLVTAKAWAGYLSSASVSMTVTVVKVNHPPEIIYAEPGNDPVMYEGGKVLFDIEAIDPDDDPLAYKWTVDGTSMKE